MSSNNGNLPLRLPLEQMQLRWASLLQPLLDSVTATPIIIPNVKLTTGSNTVNHLLGKPLTGWTIVRFQGSWAQVYDAQDTNKMPDKTLLLNSSADVTVTLEVF